MSWGETIFLKKVIDGKKTFRASDNIMVVFKDNTVYILPNEVIGTFTANTSGSLKLQVYCRVRDSYQSGYVNYNIGIRKNGTMISYLSGTLYVSTSQPEDVNSISFNIAKGDTVDIVATDNNSPQDVQQYRIAICADIIDGSLFDYTIGE